MCICCNEAEVADPLAYCPACLVHARIEFSAGFRRLTQYLAAWAAFEDWLAEREPEREAVLSWR